MSSMLEELRQWDEHQKLMNVLLNGTTMPRVKMESHYLLLILCSMQAHTYNNIHTALLSTCSTYSDVLMLSSQIVVPVSLIGCQLLVFRWCYSSPWFSAIVSSHDLTTRVSNMETSYLNSLPYLLGDGCDRQYCTTTAYNTPCYGTNEATGKPVRLD